MRYFVVCTSDVPGIEPHVIAEVVRDVSPEDQRELSLASSLAGEHAVIATRQELTNDPQDRAALDAWDARDDGEHDRETEALLMNEVLDVAPGQLRVIAVDERIRVPRSDRNGVW